MAIPTTSDYLNQIICRSLENNDRTIRYDRDIATKLNVSRVTISLYRHGQNMSVLVAVKIAELLQKHPMETISATMYHQAKREEDRKIWLHYYEKYQNQNGSKDDLSTSEST